MPTRPDARECEVLPHTPARVHRSSSHHRREYKAAVPVLLAAPRGADRVNTAAFLSRPLYCTMAGFETIVGRPPQRPRHRVRARVPRLAAMSSAAPVI